MDRSLAALDTAIAAVAAVELRSLTREALGVAAVALQGALDRVTILHARVVSEADKAGVWAGSGCRNMADWLAQHTNTSYGDAADRVRLGDAADAVPELATAVADGSLSAKAALELTDAIRHAPPGADPAELVDAVKGASPRRARAASERWREVNQPVPETAEQREDRRYRRRSVRCGQPEDGLVTTTIVLPEPEHRQFLNTIGNVAGEPHEGDGRTQQQRLADGLLLLCDAWAKGAVTGGRERASMLIVIDADIITGDAEHDATTGHGDRIPAHVARRIAENAHLQMVLRTGSHILNLGRTARYATEAHYRALVVRDGGCRWPGCHIPAAWCEIDHLTPWEHGGATDIDGLVLWCSHHHHERHRPGVVVRGNADDLSLTLANGTRIESRPPGVRTAAAAA